MDPRANTTIAYVSVPQNVAADVQYLIGCYVGIRTSQQEYSPSARVTIAVASAVVELGGPRITTTAPAPPAGRR